MDHDLSRRRHKIERQRARFDPAAAGIVVPDGDPVQESWVRCAPRLAAAQDAAPLDEPDTAADRWDASPIRRAWPELGDELERIARDGDLVAAVTDETGRILWTWGGRWMRDRAETVNFTVGGRWDEPSAGTNAVALALINNRPSTVFSAEHWCSAVRDWVCYSAPVRDAHGRPLGVVDLSTTWDRDNPLGLATVTALARVVEQQANFVPGARHVGAPGLELRVLGRGTASLAGTPVLLTRRQLEIVTVLACVDTASLGELHALLHGDRPLSPTTTKVEVSQVRRVLGDVVGSRPYRLTVPTDVDLLHLLDHLDTADLARATALYRGQLLPDSDAPFVVERRHHCDVALRTALLRRGTTQELLVFADVHPYDAEVIERAITVAGPDHPLLPTATARLAVAQWDGAYPRDYPRGSSS
ncbi:MAG TPA: hypothetical protein VK611_01745 [Acidimicrobiales bacterium]|nr:hypothetical protein [Acidimicrobiales bacterium]